MGEGVRDSRKRVESRSKASGAFGSSGAFGPSEGGVFARAGEHDITHPRDALPRVLPLEEPPVLLALPRLERGPSAWALGDAHDVRLLARDHLRIGVGLPALVAESADGRDEPPHIDDARVASI